MKESRVTATSASYNGVNIIYRREQRQVAPTAKPGVYNNIADVPTNLSIPARVGTQTDTPVVGGETEATINDRKES